MYDKLQLNNYSAKELLIGFNKKDTKDLLNHMIDNYHERKQLFYSTQPIIKLQQGMQVF